MSVASNAPAGRSASGQGQAELGGFEYRSIDSAPAGYSTDRSPSAVNGFLTMFTALSALVMLVLTILVNTGRLGETRDIVFGAHSGDYASIPVRLFIAAFAISFACSLATNVWRRLLVILELLGALVLASVALDIAAQILDSVFRIWVPVVGQQIASGLLAMIAFPIVILRNAHLPAPIPRPSGNHIRRRAWAILIGTLMLAFVTAAFALQRWSLLVDVMRELALLGGIGPGIFLVQQISAVLTAAIGVGIVARSRRTPFAAAIAVLVPAHNESHGISATIAAVDRAAAAYPAPVKIYIVDNCSSDDTIQVAREAIAACTALTGEVLECREPGKAIALNYGLAAINEEFVIRIDADTVVSEHCITRAMGHFHDPVIGAVGGLPRPTTLSTYFDRVRLVESLVRHGFFQVSLLGYDGVLGVPGMFVAYRRSALHAAGPIVQGMNGEDTDICVRINAAGYRCVVEPRAFYFSETPRTWGHMWEQRTRWFRSSYHIAGRNRHVMFSGSSMAGSVVMPVQLVNSARRTMLAPAIIFGLLMITVFHQTFPQFQWQPLVATVVGMSLLVAAGVCLAHKEYRALLYLPEYLAFRVIRSYFTAAAIMSLVYPPLHPAEAWRAPSPADSDGSRT